MQVSVANRSFSQSDPDQQKSGRLLLEFWVFVGSVRLKASYLCISGLQCLEIVGTAWNKIVWNADQILHLNTLFTVHPPPETRGHWQGNTQCGLQHHWKETESGMPNAAFSSQTLFFPFVHCQIQFLQVYSCLWSVMKSSWAIYPETIGFISQNVWPGGKSTCHTPTTAFNKLRKQTVAEILSRFRLVLGPEAVVCEWNCHTFSMSRLKIRQTHAFQKTAQSHGNKTRQTRSSKQLKPPAVVAGIAFLLCLEVLEWTLQQNAFPQLFTDGTFKRWNSNQTPFLRHPEKQVLGKGITYAFSGEVWFWLGKAVCSVQTQLLTTKIFCCYMTLS